MGEREEKGWELSESGFAGLGDAHDWEGEVTSPRGWREGFWGLVRLGDRSGVGDGASGLS